MKVLTNEAKIHLATKVDDYKYQNGEFCHEFDGGNYPIDPICISEYNPNDPDSAYAMKYLKSLWDNLSVEQVTRVCKYLGEGIINLDVQDTYKIEVGINSIFNDLDNFILRTSRITGFKGEVWEK